AGAAGVPPGSGRFSAMTMGQSYRRGCDVVDRKQQGSTKRACYPACEPPKRAGSTHSTFAGRGPARPGERARGRPTVLSMGLDVVLLSRLQFALTIMFHYLFPPLTIGMGLVLVYLEGMHLWKRDPLYHAAAKFWTRIFALNFALGVTTGIVMEFQFGTNWATYSRFVGDVFGSALAAEGIFAFFLESGFLAVLVFGWDR